MPLKGIQRRNFGDPVQRRNWQRLLFLFDTLLSGLTVNDDGEIQVSVADDGGLTVTEQNSGLRIAFTNLDAETTIAPTADELLFHDESLTGEPTTPDVRRATVEQIVEAGHRAHTRDMLFLHHARGAR